MIIEGPSGTGKTTSLRNLDPSTTIILAPNDKNPTWPGWKAQGWDKRITHINRPSDVSRYILTIARSEKYKKIRNVVIEDFTHAQAAVTLGDDFVAQANSKNPYKRWEDFGVEIYNSIFALKNLRNDLNVIILNHVKENAAGQVSFKSFGQMVGNSVDPVSYCEIVLHSAVIPATDGTPGGNKYVFITNNDGIHEAKSPMGMFNELFIPNDLKAVLDRVEEYENQEA